MVAGVKMPCIGGAFRILSDFRTLSFCGPFFVPIHLDSTMYLTLVLRINLPTVARAGDDKIG